MSPRTTLGKLVVMVALLMASGGARAGGFPRTLDVEIRGQDRLLKTTFGLLLSIDSGTSWHFLCERGIFGYLLTNTEIAELHSKFGSDGSLISGSEHGLRVSRDQGCTWQNPPTVPVSVVARERTGLPYPMNPVGRIAGLSANPSKTDATFVVAATLDDALGNALRYQLYESGDNARTFSLLGGSLDASDVGTLSNFTVAPSDASRFYFVGRGATDTISQLWMSRDGGAGWLGKRAITGTEGAESVRLLGVHPANPDMLFLRAANPPVALVPEHVLLMSVDSGKTWQEILRKNAQINAVAISPDGDTLTVGVGCDFDSDKICTVDDYGIYKTSLAEVQLARIHASSITCLNWTEAGFFACSLAGEWTWLAAPHDHPSLWQPLRAKPIAPPQEFVLASHPNAAFTLDDPAPLSVLVLDEQVKGPLPWVNERGECFPDWVGVLPGGLAYCVRFNQCPKGGEVIKVSAGPPICQRAGAGGGGAGGSGGNRGWSGGAGLGGTGPVQWTATSTNACALERPGRTAAGVVFIPLLLALGAGWRALRRRAAIRYSELNAIDS